MTDKPGSQSSPPPAPKRAADAMPLGNPVQLGAHEAAARAGLSAPPVFEIDHLVLGCAELAQGRAMLEALLGEPLPLGGKHQQMGTHNALMRLGPRQYFELIAINPDAPSPPHARWFGLDEPDIRARLQDELVPLNWVLRCPDLRDALETLPLAQQDQQDGYMVCRLWRDHLQWDMALAQSGRPAAGGGLPSLIHWSDGQEPWRAMPDLGWHLQCLRLPRALERLQGSLAQPEIVCGHGGEGLAFGLEKNGQELWFERRDHLA